MATPKRKTPIRNRYVKRLADVNDQFCYYLFIREEFKKKLSGTIRIDSEAYTTEAFPDNQYAAGIKIMINKLPAFEDENKTLNFGTYFSFSYELLAGYIEDLMELIAEISSVSLTAKEKKKDLEQQLELIIQKCGHGVPDASLFNTIKYCRLRRNYFIHDLDTLNTKFLDALNNKGPITKAYWGSVASKIDFTSHDVGNFDIDETIELFKVIKILVERIDLFVGGILENQSIARFLSKRIFSQPVKINQIVIEGRMAKLKTQAKMDFGVVLTKIDMEHSVTTIGKKIVSIRG